MRLIRITLSMSALLLALGLPAAAADQLIPTTAEALLNDVAHTDAKLIVVNFWATWCAPCRKEFPHFVKFRQDYKEKGIEVYFVSADFHDALPAATKFLADQGVTWKSYLKDEGDEALINAMNKDWSGALPATFVYDPTGKLLTFWENEVSYEELEKRVTALLH